jgi:hypothetical protein
MNDHTTTSKMAIYSKSSAIDKAISSIESGMHKNANQAAKAFGVDPTSIRNRIKGITEHKAVANSKTHQCLTAAAKQVLVDRINYLSLRQMPPTARIVKNLAKELRG